MLWEVRCDGETSEGYHSAADVSLLSQFPMEKEMLFPPLTMLTVQRERQQRQGGQGDADLMLSKVTAPNGATYTHIVVVPTFV